MKTRSTGFTVSRRDLLRAAGAGAIGLAASRIAWPAGADGKIASDAEGDVFRATVPLATPKSGRDKRMSEQLDAVSCSMFVPRGLRRIRGATVNPFYEPTVEQEHWRAAAALWGFAHIGTNFFGVRSDELGLTLLGGLRALAAASGHAEVEHVPLCIHGMSIGGGLTSRLVEALPGRVIAAAPVCLEVGPRDAASRQVPMITIFGERDGRQMELLEAKLPEARAEHAQWAIAPQWGQRHEWFRASNLVIPFYDRVIPFRYPAGAGPVAAPVKLRDYKEQQGWLGDRSTWQTAAPLVAPLAEFAGRRAQACWLPDAYTAAAWQSFVSYRPPLRIVSPAGMGDGKPFQACPAGQPIRVELAVDAGLKLDRIELLDGNRWLAAASGDPPAAVLEDPRPGIYALVGVAALPGGRRAISPLNTILVAAEQAPP